MWPPPPAATTPSASTSWPCASTTSCAWGPSPCSSSTTSPPASSTPTRWSSSSRAWRPGAAQAGCALLGGEMAEHPGSLPPGEFDLAGFTVGVVERDAMLGPARVERRRRPRGPGVAGAAVQRLHPGPPRPARAGRARPRRPRLGRRRPQPGRRAPAPVGRLRPGRARRRSTPATCTPPPTSPAGHPRQPRACAAPRARRRGRPGRAGTSRRVFAEIRRLGDVDDAEMARVFNLGIGMVLVVDAAAADRPRSTPSVAAGCRGGGACGGVATGTGTRPHADGRSPDAPLEALRRHLLDALGQDRRLRVEVGAHARRGSSTPSRRCAGPTACCSWPTPCWPRIPADATAIGGLTMGADPVAFVTAGRGRHAGPGPQGLQRPQGGQGPRRRRSCGRRARPRGQGGRDRGHRHRGARRCSRRSTPCGPPGAEVVLALAVVDRGGAARRPPRRARA